MRNHKHRVTARFDLAQLDGSEPRRPSTFCQIARADLVLVLRFNRGTAHPFGSILKINEQSRPEKVVAVGDEGDIVIAAGSTSCRMCIKKSPASGCLHKNGGAPIAICL